MEDISITLLQVPLAWENKSENLLYISKKIEAIVEATDIVVLPEMFSTGFSMNSAALAETMEGESVAWMKTEAAKKNCILCGSLIIKENNSFYNRLIWMRPDGTCSYYNKRHLFRMANENEHYSEGTKKQLVEFKGWKISLQVCYDLRFPVWSRRTEAEDYDLLIYVANWPERRNHAWKSLLVARSIENQSYVVGVNRVGSDGQNIAYSGDSVALNFLGEVLSQPAATIEFTETIHFSKSDLLEFRKNFPAQLDADDFSLSDIA